MRVGRIVPVESDRPAKIGAMDLGADGVAYVKDTLAQGAPLGALVTKLFEESGKSFAALEEGTTPERAKQFKVGTLMATAAIRKWLADYIVVRWGEGAQLIVEDPWLKVSDIRPHLKRQPYFFGGERPYYTPQGKDMYVQLTEGQKSPGSWMFSIYVLSPPVPAPLLGEHATQAQLGQMAQNTRAVLASAYDHEGYVVWEK